MGTFREATTLNDSLVEASSSSRRSIHKSTTSLPFMPENRQFGHFIMITMIVTATHDSAIRWLDRDVITTGDHSKCADGCERSRFRTAQRVLAITIVDNLALASSRQVEVAGEDFARATIAIAQILGAIA